MLAEEGARPDAPTASLEPGPARQDGVVREPALPIRLPAGEVARATIVVLGVLIGTYVVWRILEIVLLLFLAILLATAIDPAVNWLRRGPFSRGGGVLAVYGAILLAIVLPAYLVLPGTLAQAGAFVETLPERLEAVRPYAEQLQPRLLREAALDALDQARQALQNPAPELDAGLVGAGATAAHLLVNFITIFVIAFYWMVERPALKRALLRVVGPGRARRVNVVWLEIERKLGGWVRGQLILMLAIGAMAGIGYTALGLPNPLLLAVFASLGEMVPLIGPFIAFAPAVLVALAIDPSRALIVVVYAFIIQQIEGSVLVPRVMGHAVGVSPLVVLLGILIGATLYGLPGAFLAVPVAGAIQVVLGHVLGLAEPDQTGADTPTGEPPRGSPTEPPAAGQPAAALEQRSVS